MIQQEVNMSKVHGPLTQTADWTDICQQPPRCDCPEPEEERGHREKLCIARERHLVQTRITEDSSPDHPQVDQCESHEHHLDVKIQIYELRRGILHRQYGARYGAEPESDPKQRKEFFQRRHGKRRRKTKDAKVNSAAYTDDQCHSDCVEKEDKRVCPWRRRFPHPSRKAGLFEPL